MSSRKTLSASKDMDNKDGENRALIKVIDRPTFILKTREGESRAVSPSQRNGSKKDTESNTSSKLPDTRPALSTRLEMTHTVKFMDEGMQLLESPLDFLYDQQDFLVVGCVGTRGVGKSTIMSLLTANYMSDVFPTQTLSHHESGSNCTSGVDFYVTKNRVIYLDTQPILSGVAIDHSGLYEQKKNNNDFANIENNVELQSLQLTSFLLSVCHIVIFIQDWFVDPNLIRFIQTAEMLKPSSASAMDQDFVEYYPHILFLHNKAELQDFMPDSMNMMKDFYNKVFINSRLLTHSGLNMASSVVDGLLNLFVIPEITNEDETIVHDSAEKISEKLRMRIHGISRNNMTSTVLTEKNWYHYASKIMDTIKKSHLFSEYGRLMP
ncbi:nonsense-mediated mRNA decay factor SMG9 isoform X1 [Neodiprion pinetum]|uniref:nonsense-mediated mRNA decay factor SMG9 isoform X1 n=1 Tax=Neodiprion pinetum TaxID=441929 RepID=UPI001EE008A7|nr:protein SMG9 isoform X1 [Neodiprion pinetum]XP_046470204.1 protein SMG9 isoform X1 [Neodiprion pinetum]XP_046470205.1 protein SMG9 isoform X1 [Neodiprion pinetum]XP_046470206.1 protein SMG9 isoform X1 [Neodiprion pinetum]XP_046470207.1 protein SMG9 isoform X1 [Neodiprion pinetum]